MMRTPVSVNIAHPLWNYHGDIHGFIFGDKLDLTVYARDAGGNDTIIGTASLGSDGV